MKLPGIAIMTCFATLSLGLTPTTAQKVSRHSPKTRTVRAASRPEPVVVENWQTFTRQDCRLSILFPMIPEVTDAKEAEVYGQVTVRYRSVTAQTYVNQLFYMANVREYPKGLLGKRTDLAEDFGAWLKYYILQRVVILGERKISYGKYAMVEFVYRPTPQEIVVHRAVVVGDRLFQLLVQFPIPASETPEQAMERNRERIHKFFDSFYVADELVVDSTVG